MPAAAPAMQSAASGSAPSRPFVSEIFLDERVFRPGQTVRGTVQLTLARRLRCDRVEVQLHGAARVFFTQAGVSAVPLNAQKWECGCIFGCIDPVHGLHCDVLY